MLQRINTAASFFYLVSHELTSLLNLGKSYHLWKDTAESAYRAVKVCGGECRAVGVDVAGVRGAVFHYREHEMQVGMLQLAVLQTCGTHAA